MSIFGVDLVTTDLKWKCMVYRLTLEIPHLAKTFCSQVYPKMLLANHIYPKLVDASVWNTIDM